MSQETFFAAANKIFIEVNKQSHTAKPSGFDTRHDPCHTGE
jgi:hypothetical protein